MATTSTYPVHVSATLDHPSRGLWLVKWLLVIPHYVVLAFLWLGFVVTSVVAFFAILFTGRYPRPLFDYNVGVLRWTWRVSYYAYGALGTDRYPPFAFDDVPDYPARLWVEYPAHLSRGLVLVKWWLLAIPHYIVVGFFVGGGTWLADRSDENWNWSWGSGGLVGVLVLVAAVILLFGGTYPRSLFDVVLGMQRWALRVAGYAALMTDVYPPFRLDLGGDDPDASAVEPSVAPSGAAGAITSPVTGAPGQRQSWSAGRVVAVVAGSLLALAAMGPLIGGLALTVADRVGRDDAGYLTSPTVSLRTDGYAVTSDRILLESGGPAWAVPSRVLGTARLRVIASDPSRPVFLGVARTADVEAYLSGVASSTPVDLRGDRRVTYTEHPGGAPTAAPGAQTFWTRSVSGAGEQTLSWKPVAGEWTVVLMNADGGRPVAATLDAAATAPAVTWIGAALVLAGVLALAAGAATIVAAVATGRRTGAPTTPMAHAGP